MRHTDRYSKSCLPVPLKLMAPEIKIPVCNTIKFTCHSLSSKLVHSTFCLLCSRKFSSVTEHINSRDLKGTIGTHGFSQGRCLCFQSRLLHHMSGQGNAMFLTPASHSIRKSLCKTLRNVVMILITDSGNCISRKFPEQFRKMLKKAMSICITESFFQIIGIWNSHIHPLICKIQALFMGKLRLICKDGRNGFPKLLSQIFIILLVGYLDKTLHCLFIQCVQIRLIIKPWIITGHLKIGKPFLKSLLQRCILIDLFILCKITILQPYLISSKECTLIASDRLSGRTKFAVFNLFSILALRSKKQKTDPVFVVSCYQSAACSGWPAVFIIQPGQHIFFQAFFPGIFYQIQKLFAHVRIIHSCAAVDMSAAHSHFLQSIQSIVDLRFCHLTVPCPERSRSVLASRILKFLFCKLFPIMIQHTLTLHFRLILFLLYHPMIFFLNIF